MEKDFNLDPLTVKPLFSFTKRKFESFIHPLGSHSPYLSIFYNPLFFPLIISWGDLAFYGRKQT